MPVGVVQRNSPLIDFVGTEQVQGVFGEDVANVSAGQDFRLECLRDDEDMTKLNTSRSFGDLSHGRSVGPGPGPR